MKVTKVDKKPKIRKLKKRVPEPGDSAQEDQSSDIKPPEDKDMELEKPKIIDKEENMSTEANLEEIPPLKEVEREEPEHDHENKVDQQKTVKPKVENPTEKPTEKPREKPR